MLKQNEISIELQGQAGKHTQDKGAARILKATICAGSDISILIWPEAVETRFAFVPSKAKSTHGGIRIAGEGRR